MSVYRIRLLCERGPEPLTGEILEQEEETVEVEADSPWQAYRRAASHMTINPSGRLLQGYNAETGELILPPESREPFCRGQFIIADVQGPYEGYSKGESWNGWAVPFFELEEALRIAEDYASVAREAGGDLASATGRYDEGERAVVLYDPIYEEEVAYDATTIVVDGKEVEVYPVGTREWTWEESSP